MKVCVTGGTGFTGAALASRLIEDGHQVNIIDKQAGLMADELKARGANLILADLADEDALGKALDNCEVVFHVAAAFREINVPESEYYRVNVEGTRLVAARCVEARVRKLVYCSTQGVHGDIHDPPGDENSPVAPADYYQATKYEGELELQAISDSDLEYTILRPTAIYGPGDPGRFLMLFKQAKKGVFPMFGSGRTFYHPVYIDNLVDAFLLAAKPDTGSGQAYIIGDSEFVTIEDLVRRVAVSMDVQVSIPHFPLWPLSLAGRVCEAACKPFGIRPPIFPRRVDWFQQVRAFRIDKAARDLGYSPRIGLDEGLKRSCEWYREQGLI
ncbi:MAG: NAD-dependent epimerase/dehydratase family protein [Gammaproteobacteria bacterium]